MFTKGTINLGQVGSIALGVVLAAIFLHVVGKYYKEKVVAGTPAKTTPAAPTLPLAPVTP